MRIKLSGQLAESKKVRIRRQSVAVVAPKKVRGQNMRQEGTLWKNKMQTMALRLKKGRTRRDRSGAPMKRG